jgi:hypothetical protein
MLSDMDVFVVDVAIEIHSRFVGRPLQRLRARRLAKRGKIRSILFAADKPGVLPARVLDGVAEVWEGRIRLWGADLWIQDMELPPEAGPLGVFDENSRRRPRADWDGDLVFGARTWVYTLRTHQGRVRWSVLDWQAGTALTMLGFPDRAPDTP